MTFDNAAIFPLGATINERDRLTFGGCDAVELASEFGTPLYVYDELTLRSMCREFVGEFGRLYPKARVVYASKAYVNQPLGRLLVEEGIGIDVVSGGELAVALASGFPAEAIYFHGNNKSRDELRMALDNSVGKIVVDNFHELALLEELVAGRSRAQQVMVRVSPGIDPHTHEKTTTGTLDSKFGFSVETGDAARAIRLALETTGLDLVGIHFHLGSPIFELEPYSIAIDTVLTFLAPFKDEGLDLREFSPGGGFAIGYVRDELPPPISSYAQVITTATRDRCAALGFGEPLLVVEPGRALVGRAGVALYTAGAIKDIPAVRKYVSVDGGMGDNIRPALYHSQYEAVVANRMSDGPAESVTIAGKFCESGDVLVRDLAVPTLEPGDIIAIPASGAYAPAMASNYNLNPRPAVVIVRGGEARLIRRRESFEDMMALDVAD